MTLMQNSMLLKHKSLTKYERSLTDKTVMPVALVVKNNSKIREKSDTPVCEIVALEKVDNWV